MSAVDARGRSSALPSPAAPPRSSLAGWAEGVAGGSGNPARVPGGSPSLCCKAGPGARPPPTSSRRGLLRLPAGFAPAAAALLPCAGFCFVRRALSFRCARPAPHLHRLPGCPVFPWAANNGSRRACQAACASRGSGRSIHDLASRRVLTALPQMQVPSLRRPVGASVLAGVLGAGLCDALLTGSHGGGPAFSPSPWGFTARSPSWPLHGQLALNALASARPPGWGTLRENLAQDRAVAAGILAGCVAVLVTAVVAAAGQRLFVGKMQSQKLATIAAAGMVAIGALPGALAALLSLPLVRRWFGVSRRRGPSASRAFSCWRWPAWARSAWWSPFPARTGGSSTSVRSMRWPPPSASASGTACSGSAAPPASIRGRLPAAAGTALLAAGAPRSWGWRSGPDCPESSPTYAAVADNGWGLRALLAAARRVTDWRRRRLLGALRRRRLRRPRRRRLPGRRGHPRRRHRSELRGRRRQGRPPRPTPRRPRPTAAAPPAAPIKPRAGAFDGNILIVTIDAFRADRLGVGRLRPPGRALADADARRAGAAGRLLPARLVAGAQHAALVPVDPHRPLPVGHRLGQAGA